MNTNSQFPYPGFPYKLQYLDKKDKKVCYFECKEHLDKYLLRNKLKKKDIEIEINKKTNKKTNQ